MEKTERTERTVDTPGPRGRSGAEREALGELVELARTRHWRDVVGPGGTAGLEGLRAPTLDRRGGFFYIEQGPGRSSRVLVFGGRYGAAVDPLADFYSEVVVYEPDAAYSDFLRSRFRQDERENVMVMDSGRIPELGEPSFDFVIVADWDAALGNLQAFGADEEQGVVNACRSVLRDGGRFAMAAGNRFRPQRNQTKQGRRHCAPGYQRLVESAGFAGVETWSVFPDHITPSMLVPFDEPELIRVAMRRSRFMPRSRVKSVGVRLLLRLGVYRYIAPGFVVTGSRL